MKSLFWALPLLLPCGAYAQDVAWPAAQKGTTGGPVRVVAQNLQQGGFWLAEVPKHTQVFLGGAAVPLVQDPKSGQTYALVGFDRAAPAVRWLKLCAPQTPCITQKLALKARTYATQNVKGAPSATLEPDKAALKRMEADSAAIAAARRQAVAQASKTGGFLESFGHPVRGAAITGVFGSRRLFEGEEKSWHKGTDFAAPTGTPVYAPASGVVRLARNTFMSGNLIMLDHGATLHSLYAHLNRMDVRVGQRVEKGQKLGEVGTTGRSSGPHLHWGVYVGGVAIDPALWLKPLASTGKGA